jgi:hypothetical protein
MKRQAYAEEPGGGVPATHPKMILTLTLGEGGLLHRRIQRLKQTLIGDTV